MEDLGYVLSKKICTKRKGARKEGFLEEGLRWHNGGKKH